MKDYSQNNIKELMKITFTVISFDKEGNRQLTHGCNNAFQALQAVIVANSRNAQTMIFEGQNVKHTHSGWRIEDYKDSGALTDYFFMSNKIKALKNA